jgi:glycerol-3-phosphate dehydrogenase
VIGGGVVGCAVLHALARRGVQGVLLESAPGLALGASGANSGIVHTGFDSPAGTLETALILRSARLREQLLEELGVSVRACGALLRPRDERERKALEELARNARANEVQVVPGDDGSLAVPGESISDPVGYAYALADAAVAAGAQVRLEARVVGLAAARGGIAVELDGGDRIEAGVVANCAGLYADEVAELVEAEPFGIYPRKGEFLVFAPASRAPLEQILLPVPSALGKGVLVFPTLDGHVIAGPTAKDRDDKDDWSVEPDARELIMQRAAPVYPPLADMQIVGAYAGLRPAGRPANYAIEASAAVPGLVHVGAIRSTGLTASLAIGEHVAALLGEGGAVQLGQERPLPTPAQRPADGAWWERAATYHASASS